MNRFGITATLLFYVACSTDDPKPDPAQPQAVASDPAAPEPAVAPPGRPWVGTPAVAHVRIAGMRTLVDEARRQLVPESLAGMVTIDALIDKVVESSDQRAVAEALDLGAASACVLSDEERPEVGEGVCAISVRGGAKAMLPAFGPPFAPAARGDHVAHFVRPPNPEDEDETEPVHVYLDDFAGFVVISDAEEGFDALGEVAVAIAKRPGRDFEFVFYPDQLAASLGPELRAELQTAVDGRTTPDELRKRLGEKMDATLSRIPGLGSDDTKDLDEALPDVDPPTPEEAKQLLPLIDAVLTVLSDVHEFGVGLDIEPAGVVMASWYRADPNSALQRALRAGPKLQPDHFHGVPASSVLVRGSVPIPYSPLVSVDPALLEEIGLGGGVTGKLVSLALESFLEDSTDPALAADLDAFVAEQSALYSGASTWAFFGDGDGPYGLMLRWPLVKSAPARASWASAAKRFPPERVLGEDGAKELQWSFESGVASVGKTPVDRWTVRSKPSTEDIPADDTLTLDIVEPLADFLETSIAIDTFERDGTFTALLTKAGSPALTLVDTEASAVPPVPPGLATALSRGDHVLSLWAVDVKKVRALVSALADDMDAEKSDLLAKDVGKDFGDLYGVTYLTDSGGAAELVVSQQLIDQLRRL